MFHSEDDCNVHKKSIGHISLLFENEKCILPYHYGIADVLFMPVLIDVGLFWTDWFFPTTHINIYNKTECILLSIVCTVNFLEYMIHDSLPH